MTSPADSPNEASARTASPAYSIAHPVAPSLLSAADLHCLEGVAVYFGGLVMLYELVQRFECRAVPVGRPS